MNILDKSIHLFSEECKRHFDQKTGEPINAHDISTCPVCFSSKLSYKFVINGFSYVRCQNCRFMFANPRLNELGSSSFYNSDFYNALLDTEYYKINDSEDIYYSSSHDDPQLISTVCNKLVNFLPKDARILDFGCGGGALLQRLRDLYGYKNLMGIDLNRRAVDFAKKIRGLEVVCGTGEELKCQKRFDAVLCIEIIEHINEFSFLFNNIDSFLKSNGLLLITTPRNDSLSCLIFGKEADSYMAPNHINFFNDRNLSLLLNRHAFRLHGIKFLYHRMGIGTLYKRLFKKREYVSYSPPLTGPPLIYLPKKFSGDIRQYINNNGFKYTKLSNNLKDNEYSSIQYSNLKSRFIKLLSKIISIPLPTHMVVMALKNDYKLIKRYSYENSLDR